MGSVILTPHLDRVCGAVWRHDLPTQIRRSDRDERVDPFGHDFDDGVFELCSRPFPGSARNRGLPAFLTPDHAEQLPFIAELPVEAERVGTLETRPHAERPLGILVDEHVDQHPVHASGRCAMETGEPDGRGL